MDLNHAFRCLLESLMSSFYNGGDGGSVDEIRFQIAVEMY